MSTQLSEDTSIFQANIRKYEEKLSENNETINEYVQELNYSIHDEDSFER